MAADASRRGDIAEHPRNGLPGVVKAERRSAAWSGGRAPTPRKAALLPTILSNDVSRGNKDRTGEGGPSLRSVVKTTHGTPGAQNGLRGGSGDKHRPMKWMYPGHPEYGELNPDWTEWLMGWPVGWTSLEPLPSAAFDAWRASVQCEEARAGAPGWWDTDPSASGAVPRTVPPSAPNRIARIAAIGNGQAAPVVPAAFLFLSTLKTPE